ncbi:hypothetical protein L0P88_12400 [Muricauda sp. SCSIO 64092]|uniref:hypothetical protein n=1 Tax=Allomuricauda sp. SCSIO 64092 TaxID=2908842 RepID=UPI001FF34E55|nr:hypothetical protein [Muricauda sp. SCSIO 64092]UOY04758.1 hypothetical protein L0P88_12400 [Muricauda sp. SCSIO 64092]
MVILLFFCVASFGQKKQEQEFRIDKKELPNGVLALLSNYLENTKRLRYYKERDGEKSSYEVKFKKDKLHYSIEFDEKGALEDVELLIKQTDIPNAAFDNMTTYLQSNHKKYRIKKIQRQYVNTGDAAQTLKEAFQNRILPKLKYELIIATKDENGYGEFELTFDANGEHLLTRKAVKTKYDHVLFQ